MSSKQPMGPIGSSFDSWLEEEGIKEEVNAVSLKRVLAWQIEEAMKHAKITKVEMARRMHTSRTQLQRLLDPDIKTIGLDIIIRAASAVGRGFTLQLN